MRKWYFVLYPVDRLVRLHWCLGLSADIARAVESDRGTDVSLKSIEEGMYSHQATIPK